MRKPEHITDQFRSAANWMCGVLGMVLIVGLLHAGSASAAVYEQKDTFAGGGTSPIAVATSMAVNTTGAGGVPAGTMFVVTSGTIGHLVRYSGTGAFVSEKTIGDSLHKPLAVSIDQATGDVYILLSGSPGVEILSPDGSATLFTFAGRAAASESIAASPEKLHVSAVASGNGGGIAVDESGTVYIADLGYPIAAEINAGGQQSRVMVFKPQSPGDFEHYVYTGTANDIAVSRSGDAVNYSPVHLALNAAGHLYTGNEFGIYEFDPGVPTVPVCSFSLPTGGMQAMTVAPGSGQVFYISYKAGGNGHQLSCGGLGKFEEVGDSPQFTISPKPTQGTPIEAIAFNPTLTYKPPRPASVLYAASFNGLGYIFVQPDSEPPVVESESVVRVTSTTATLNAQINPEGPQTSYAFQYITLAAYEANPPAERFLGAGEAPLGGTPLGSGLTPLAASVVITGLAPDTSYRYRVVATSEAGVTPGEAEPFQTFPAEAGGLPDGRAYELVSPVQKHGGEVLPPNPSVASCGGECKPGAFLTHFTMQSSPDGEAVAYEGYPFTTEGGAVQENEYLSRRTESGWETTGLSLALQGSGAGAGYKGFNSDLTKGVFKQTGPALSPGALSGFQNLYGQTTAGPAAVSPVLLSPPLGGPVPSSFHLIYAGASADFSRLFFEADYTLETSVGVQPEEGGEHSNNLYEWSAGQLRLVNVFPDETTTFDATYGALPESPNALTNLSHAISSDGSRVFWTSGAGQVYVRIGAAVTEEIEDGGDFLTASSDGSKVLLDDGCLYDLQAKSCEDLTMDKSSVHQGGFEGIIGAGEDLSRVYFVDTKALTEASEVNANPLGPEHAEDGKSNLYAWHAGVTKFVGQLLAGDAPGNGARGDWSASPALRTAQVSPNGEWATFSSAAQLTGYDNVGPCKVISGTGEFESGACKEAFLYEAATDKLICASCNRGGALPLGPTNLPIIVEGVEGSVPQPRYLTNAGRLYFDSQDSLSPFDTNAGSVPGHAVEDVYEYQPNNVGGCTRGAGCVSLISAGHGAVDSNFLAADATGKNVFFTTRDHLVTADRDELVDLYDAREGGGFPEVKEAGECQGEGCQPSPPVQSEPAPTTPNIEGPGNVTPPKGCKKGQVKKKGRCVKKPHKKKAHHNKRAKHERGGSK